VTASRSMGSAGASGRHAAGPTLGWRGSAGPVCNVAKEGVVVGPATRPRRLGRDQALVSGPALSVSSR